MKDLPNSLVLTIYQQEKQTLQLQRIADRNQFVCAIFLMLMAVAYYIHIQNPEMDLFVLVLLILLLSLASIFSLWVSYLSNIRSCELVDGVESQIDLPDHLRKDAWVWNYTLRSKWNLISKFLIVLLVALMALSLAGIFTYQKQIDNYFSNKMEPYKNLTLEDKSEIRSEYQRREALSFMFKLAALFTILFLLLITFNLGKLIGYNMAKIEQSQHSHEHGEQKEHGEHGEHTHGLIPIPNIQKEFNEKYQSLNEIQKRVTVLEEQLKKKAS
ncbi:MAG: hypothetical protein AABZ60_11565 [Planctomycetota bacterium]